MNKKSELLKTFQIPIVVFFGIIIYLILKLLHQETSSILIILTVTALGSFRLFKESFMAFLKKQFALDYIAILAILVSVFTGEYIVAGILALMIASGRTLEDYGVAQAKKSLTKLADRIPNEVILWENNRMGARLSIGKVKKGDEIMGGRVRVKVVKNKVAAPFKVTEFDLLYNEGISQEGEMLALGEKFGLVDKAGASYSYGEEKLGRGYDAARTYLRENKKVAAQLLKEIRQKIKEQV